MENDDVRELFKKLKDCNNKPFVQASILKRTIPYLYQSISFLAYPSIMGSELDELIDTVERTCFNHDLQSRLVFAIVQAYGCGKTKMGLMLTKQFVVLPWRTLKTSALVSWLQQKQDTLLVHLNKSPSYQEVESFSNQCLRLLKLMLHGHVALYNAFVANHFHDEDNFMDRFYFALMLLNPTKCVTDWIIQWVEQNQNWQTNEEEKEKKRKVVFLMDEVHELIDICRGYCLHRNTISFDSGEDNVLYWRKEQTDKAPAPDKNYCTDLFYQLRCIMLNSMALPHPPFGFIMCSTEFRTWDIFEVANSPFSRGLVKKFFHLHDFSNEDVQNTLLEFFTIDDAILKDPLIHYNCSKLVRPLLQSLCKTYFTVLINLLNLELRTGF